MTEDNDIPETYVRNCFIMPKEDEPKQMFISRPEAIYATLDGYAIIPIEEYNRLKEKAGEN